MRKAAVRWPAPPTKREAHRAGGRRRARLASNTGVRLRASDCNAPGRLRLAATRFEGAVAATAAGCLAAVIERKLRRGACRRHPIHPQPIHEPCALERKRWPPFRCFNVLRIRKLGPGDQIRTFRRDQPAFLCGAVAAVASERYLRMRRRRVVVVMATWTTNADRLQRDAGGSCRESGRRTGSARPAHSAAGAAAVQRFTNGMTLYAQTGSTVLTLRGPARSGQVWRK